MTKLKRYYNENYWDKFIKELNKQDKKSNVGSILWDLLKEKRRTY